MSDTQEPQDDPTKEFQPDTMDLILEVYKNEYDAIQDSIGTFENRTGVLITLAGALLAFEGSNFVIPHKMAQVSGLVVAIEILSIIAVTLSILALVLVITIRRFSRVNHQSLNSPSAFKNDKKKVTGLLIATYWEATVKTRTVIDRRAFWYHVGLWLLFSSLVLITLGRIVALYVEG
ncbi:hypothetical protein JZ785_10060 [Alicyclobacillus curvatus]|nr:hypothetical protein JZ785_10060 [Alicyclobacillus curvatus]